MQNTIKKAKIKGMTLEGGWEEVIFPENASPITNDLTKKSDQLIHPDLRAAFDRLKPHLVLICEQKEDTFVKLHTETGDSIDDLNLEQLDHVDVSGFVISGSNEHLGVTLIGSKSVECGTLNLISPFTKYKGDYKHGLDLADAIQACVYEVEEYLFRGKCAINQLELPFNGEPDTDDMMVTMMADDMMVTMMADGVESTPIDLKKLNKRLKNLEKVE